MRRRDLAALLIVVPLLIGLLLYAYYPESWDLLLGYMLAVALAFKGAILSFYSASKLKLIAFFKGLTLLQGAYLLIKRWFLDNVFSRWLRRNILDHISSALREAKEYYLGLDLRAKFRNLLLAVGITALSFWALHLGGYLSHLVLFTELKVVVISLSKTALMILGKLSGVLFNSWLTPILEVFAFSWFFSWLERTLGPQHPVNRFLSALGYQFGRLFSWMGVVSRRYIDPLLNDKVSQKSRELAQRATDYIQNRKIAYELEQFDKMEQAILGAHIDAYFTFKDMEKIRDKRTLYSLINQKTKDGIDIVAFVSRNDKGELLPVEADDDFYNDVFLLEGLASSQKYGVKKELDNAPDYSDFWVLNTSLYPATLRSHSGVVDPVELEPQNLKFISCRRLPDYHDGDLYLEFRGRTEAFIPVEEKSPKK